jgi:FtsH-binding integral membrane protein
MIPIKLILKMAIITSAIIILPVIYSLYQLAKGSLYGFIIGWCLAGIIMCIVINFYVKQKFRSHIESLESHEVY